MKRGRCPDCGGALRSMTVRRYNEALSVGLVLLGCLLAMRLIGLLILPLGAFMFTRTRQRQVCDSCAVGRNDSVS